ncbi:MAG: glycosyl hydrolase 115 family protein [Lachnospiraceae bacterium]|nr:glycosyl hydrolase 115 family protein [Lachnospiraceae bacterium]
MGFILSGNTIDEKDVAFIYEEEALSGVKKIADKVRGDIELVFSSKPLRIDLKAGEGIADLHSDEVPLGYPVIFGTAGHSRLLESLDKEGLISLSAIRGKREVYSVSVLEEPFPGTKAALVIAGSDKRGTVYGLFHISEILNVSPFADWCDVIPGKMTEFIFDCAHNMISKEPSVRYRGFFINDEWPAFGNWANKNFGGFNAGMYEHVFELLLRLKGNYLWPAMWTSIFPDDGPGLLNAELADELGVVMGMSHHEPCLRQGEEYKYLRGPGSVYGDAWDFKKNREGIIRFWEDGLKRGGKFENVITVGMRGEFDSTIMGSDATLKDNIDLLRDVLKEQNRLIRENVNTDLARVPRMLALYKEVEPFYYGDEETEGLMGDPELDGVTLMLCDDNFGNLRTLPTEQMRDHKGGYGMYYHFDYHGWPVSYEWVNSSYLPKVWEQMTNAYEFGIRDLWIVNVGDIFTNEYPLSYFLELAYDYDKWGISNINSADEYNKLFVDRQFGDSFSDLEKKTIASLLKGYTRIANNRRPEAMNDKVYHPVNYGELEDLSLEIEKLMTTADKVSESCTADNAFAYFELVGYPLVATLNLTRMWLAATENHYLTDIQATLAGKLADEVRDRLKLDRALTDKLHEIRDGKWYGMGMSGHVGFKYWNEEECAYPVIYERESADKARLIVSIPGTDQHTEGGFWNGKKLVLPDFLDPGCDSARITLFTVGRDGAVYEVRSDAPWLSFSDTKGTCPAGFFENIYVKLERSLLNGDDSSEICIKGEFGEAKVWVPVNNRDYSKLPDNTYVWLCRDDTEKDMLKPFDYISIEAGHYASLNETKAGKFVELPDFGRTLSGLKVFPVTGYFEPGKDAPSIDYLLYADSEDEYDVTLYIAPVNPVGMDGRLLYGISVSAGDLAGKEKWSEEIETINAIPDGFKVGDDNHIWGSGALENIRKSRSRVILSKGINTLRIFAVTPGFVPEKIVISKAGKNLPESYLGPKETFRVKRET